MFITLYSADDSVDQKKAYVGLAVTGNSASKSPNQLPATEGNDVVSSSQTQPEDAEELDVDVCSTSPPHQPMSSSTGASTAEHQSSTSASLSPLALNAASVSDIFLSSIPGSLANTSLDSLVNMIKSTVDVWRRDNPLQPLSKEMDSLKQDAQLLVWLYIML